MHSRALLAAALVAGCAAPSAPPADGTPTPPPPAAAPATPAPPPTAAPAEIAAAPEASAPITPGVLASLFGSEYERALAAVGLERRDARCTAADMAVASQGQFRVPLYEALQSDPTLADRYARTFRDAAFAAAPSAEKAVSFAAARIGAGVRMTLLGDPLKDEATVANDAVALELSLRGLLAPSIPPTDSVPPKVRAAAALVLRAARRAREWRKRALGGEEITFGVPLASPGNEAAEDTLLLSEDDEDPARRVEFERVLASVDLPYMARAAAEVALAAELAGKWVAEIGPTEPFEWRCATPSGEVLLRGGGDDADGDADGGPFLLRIDTGGNDAYAAGAASSPSCPVSVLIDATGNDTYRGRPGAPAFGAGWRGVGVLLDLAGDDRYELGEGRSLGLGAGVLGAGILVDTAGDDRYAGTDFCMGAATAGFGVLCDLGGTDRYEALSYSQGFGFVRGSGLLVDLAGDDVYALDDTPGRRASPQSKEHNISLGQGAGYGLRSDYLDGHSLAGGVGILADREGNDRYACGVFGQGVGYWMGVGLLLEGGGSDTYSGIWYCQGATAHFAVGILDDASGDDTYTATLNMAQGAGHDYAVGVLLDRRGNDRYDAPNLSLGSGNADGVGLFVDAGGDDAYRSLGLTLGGASVATPADAPSLRHGSLTLGVFVDLGGTDAYLDREGKPHPFAGEGLLWTWSGRAGAVPFSNERGAGIDAAGDPPRKP